MCLLSASLPLPSVPGRPFPDASPKALHRPIQAHQECISQNLCWFVEKICGFLCNVILWQICSDTKIQWKIFKFEHLAVISIHFKYYLWTPENCKCEYLHLYMQCHVLVVILLQKCLCKYTFWFVCLCFYYKNKVIVFMTILLFCFFGSKAFDFIIM